MLLAKMGLFLALGQKNTVTDELKLTETVKGFNGSTYLIQPIVLLKYECDFFFLNKYEYD